MQKMWAIHKAEWVKQCVHILGYAWLHPGLSFSAMPNTSIRVKWVKEKGQWVVWSNWTDATYTTGWTETIIDLQRRIEEAFSE